MCGRRTEGVVSRYYFMMDVRMYITQQQGENDECNREPPRFPTVRVDWGW